MHHQTKPQSTWLRSYYYTRAGFSIFWVIGPLRSKLVPCRLLASRHLPRMGRAPQPRRRQSPRRPRANRSQMLNVFASSVMTIIVLFAVMKDTHAVLAAFGIWAILSGLLQLYTRHPALAVSWSAVGDDPERRAVNAGRRLHDQAVARFHAADHS